MTKLGTPIGAGAKGATVTLGFSGDGEPPLRYAEPPLTPDAGGWTPAVAGGALTPPLEAPLPAAAAPRSWLWTAAFPPLSFALPASSVAPAWTPPCAVGVGAGGLGASIGAASTSPEGEGGEEGSSLTPSEAVQSGSLASARPSPSSSGPLQHSGSWPPGAAGAVSPTAGWPVSALEEGSAPAQPTPRAVANAKLARAMVSASLFLIPECPCRRSSTLPGWMGVRNAILHPPTRP